MVDVVKFLKDDTGATAIEYALIAALVSIAAIVSFGATGETILSAFTNISEGFCVAIGGDFELSDTGEDSCS
ncbi:MAG: Flp family type IVb pilin [Sneathiella sp.]